MQSTVPADLDNPLVIDLLDAEPLCTLFTLLLVRRGMFPAYHAFAVDSSVVFWSPEVKVGEPAVYQILLSAPLHTYISSLPFSSLSIHFDDQVGPVLITRKALDGDSDPPLVQRIDMGQVDLSSNLARDSLCKVEADLRWKPGSTIVFTGTLTSIKPTTLKVGVLPYQLGASTDGHKFRSQKLC